MTRNQRETLKKIGIRLWELREKRVSVDDCDRSIKKNDAWKKIEAEVEICRQCVLHETRSRVVFGKGSRDAELLIVGEAPGAEEDKQGVPFVGKAGLLLDQMLEVCGTDPKEVYIANVVKCRPPDNRNPEKLEVNLCLNFLLKQIELISPKAILVLGRVAAHTLLNCNESLAKLRGRVHYDSITSVPIIVTYHPAYLLRSPREKAKSWLDLRLFKKMVEKHLE